MIIEPDQHYYENGVYVWTPDRCKTAWEQCYRRLEELLQSGDYRRLILLIGVPGSGKSTWAGRHDTADVILFDGVFAQPVRRKEALAMAARYGVQVEAICLDTDLAECLLRNSRRSPDRKVPEETIRQMHESLHANFPSCAEGFVNIHRVAVSQASGT